MKIRFYRGPMDGRVVHRVLPPGETSIRINIPNTSPGWMNVGVDDYLNPSEFAPHQMYSTHTYVRTRHTHPDGSVYFEWDRPKGTRFKD